MASNPSNGAEMDYVPRQSSRIKSTTTGDGDTWQEKLVVCEAAGNKLVIRSYFRNSRTGKRTWDEPPSGASDVRPASEARRRECEEELKNLQFAMDTAPAPADMSGALPKKKGKGFFSAFLKKKKNPKDNKKGTKDKNDKKVTIADDSGIDGDEDMQRAISLSMGLQAASNVNSQTESINQWQEDKEAIEMAKAISMSEAATNELPSMATEEEMLQRALEASRNETKIGVASLPAKSDADFIGYSEMPSNSNSSSFEQNGFQKETEGNSDDNYWNQKMPGKPIPTPQHTSSTSNNSAFAMSSFDPYAQPTDPTPVTATVASTTCEHQQNSTSDGLQNMQDVVNGNMKSARGFDHLMFKKTNDLKAKAGIV